MANINWGRVILGGLVAGVVLNIFDGVMQSVVLADAWATAMKAMNKTPAFAVGQIVQFNILNFVGGIFIVWLYASMRPRYGAGAGTAIRAGLAMWFAAILVEWLDLLVAGIVPANLVFATIGVGVVQYAVAGLAGGKLYKE